MIGRDVDRVGSRNTLIAPGHLVEPGASDHLGKEAMGNDRDEGIITRRRALAAAAAGALLGALPGCEAGEGPSRRTRARMPAIFLPHGGGPWPFVELGFGSREEQEALAAYLRSIASVAPERPEALLVVSAHWEESVPTVTTGERPPLLFDYHGFPEEAYRLTWPAPGHPALAARVRGLLGAAGFTTAEDRERGFDHGTFVPLKLAYPRAEIPTVQLSLKRSLDPEAHLAMGRALAPLRDEGILIVGSGMTFHNLRAFGPSGRPAAAAFDAWLGEAVTAEPAERARRLARWSDAPSARQAHPREEHLLPLMVVAGAALAERGHAAYGGTLLGLRLSGYHFG